MNWKYGLKKYKSSYSDDDLYEITEIFDNNYWVEDSLEVLGDSPEEVIEMLELMLKDLKEDLVIIEVGNKNKKEKI